MIFLYPEALFLLFIIPILVLYDREKSKKSPFSNEVLNRISVKNRFRKIASISLYLSLIFIIFSLSRPVIKSEEIVVERFPKIEILLDITNSMKIELRGKTRFEVAKDMLKRLIENRTASYSISLFGNGILNISAQSFDRVAVISILDSINIDLIDIDEINITKLQNYESPYQQLIVTDKDIELPNRAILNLNSKLEFNFEDNFEISSSYSSFEELFYYPLLVGVILFLIAI